MQSSCCSQVFSFITVHLPSRGLSGRGGHSGFQSSPIVFSQNQPAINWTACVNDSTTLTLPEGVLIIYPPSAFSIESVLILIPSPVRNVVESNT